jgi:hypothetical protein
MHYISKAHAYFINPSKIHHKSIKFQRHKFIIISSTSQSSTSLLRRRRLQLWPPRLRWWTGLRWRTDAINRQWRGSGIVWTRWRRLHKREEIASVRLKIKNFGSTSPARGGFQPATNTGTKAWQSLLNFHPVSTPEKCCNRSEIVAITEIATLFFRWEALQTLAWVKLWTTLFWKALRNAFWICNT